MSQLLLVEPESTVVDIDELAGGDVLGIVDAVGLMRKDTCQDKLII